LVSLRQHIVDIALLVLVSSELIFKMPAAQHQQMESTSNCGSVMTDAEFMEGTILIALQSVKNKYCGFRQIINTSNVTM